MTNKLFKDYNDAVLYAMWKFLFNLNIDICMNIWPWHLFLQLPMQFLDLVKFKYLKWVNVFNVVDQQFIAMYDSGC